MREETVYLDSGACEHYFYVECRKEYGKCGSMWRLSVMIDAGIAYDGYTLKVSAGEGEEIRYTVRLTSWHNLQHYSVTCKNLQVLIGKTRAAAAREVSGTVHSMIEESIELSYDVHGGLREALFAPFAETIGKEAVHAKMEEIEGIETDLHPTKPLDLAIIFFLIPFLLLALLYYSFKR